jgi:hypothetical protein
VPVAVGMSDLEGVIVYSDDKGATCQSWNATISDDLEALIKAAATFNEYSPDDFLLIDEMKRADPDGLRLVLETDPLRPFYTQKESAVERLLNKEIGT